MKIGGMYSHLNGLEYLKYHKPNVIDEVEAAIRAVDAVICKNYASAAKKTLGTMLYSPKEMNASFENSLAAHGWKSRVVTYWVSKNPETVRDTLQLLPEEQKKEIIRRGETPVLGRNQTDFWKDRVGIEVQFGHYASVAYDLSVKHMAFYAQNLIDVGIEILPMKALLDQMSSGPACYEQEMHNLVRAGRTSPAVPLIMYGIEP